MKRRVPIRKHQRRPLYLRQWREFRNLSQVQLAERAEISQGMISQLEQNKTDYSGETLAKLAFALSCEPVDLLIRNPQDAEAPWSLLESLKPTERRIAVEMLRGLKRASGE